MREIIILETFPGTGLGDTTVRHAFWFAVPLARRVPKANATSVYRDASALELVALQDGSVYEESYSIQIPAGQTIAQIKTLLEGRYAARLTTLSALPNVNQFYGNSWDGTIWT